MIVIFATNPLTMLRIDFTNDTNFSLHPLRLRVKLFSKNGLVANLPYDTLFSKGCRAGMPNLRGLKE